MKRPRGRPIKPKPAPQKVFLGDGFDLSKVTELSHEIAAELGIPPNDLTEELAEAGMKLQPMTNLQKVAPLKRKGSGRRPDIHRARLLCDCALALEKHQGLDARNELERIYDGTKGEDSYPVIKAAKAVLIALEIEHDRNFSLRRQARNALDIL